MERPPLNDPPGYLVNLAAEAMAPLIPGCRAAVGPGAESVDGTRRKAITYFGPAIIRGWLAALESRHRAEQDQAFAQLASLAHADSRREALAGIDRYAPAADAADKILATEYLAAIPLALRRSIVTDPATGTMTVPPLLWSGKDKTLIRLLPVDVPPFAIGSELPGTSYRLEELLGIGGFGAVYKASNRFEQNQPPRAIKFCLDPSMVVTLQREQALLDRLMAVADTNWSSRIVRLYGYALDAQPPFLVYEYVPGGDLTNYLTVTRHQTGRGFDPALALELIRQVAEALAFAHRNGLVHRDLKPANVLVSGPTIKLTDFGIGGVVATHAVRGHPLTSATAGLSTAADHARIFRGSGTPLYMSAEQRRGDPPDPRHDLYSLGVMWYQLLVGDVTRELHPGWPDELMEEHQTPREHIELLQRCVGYFKKRPADSGELLALLRCASTAQKPLTTGAALSGESAQGTNHAPSDAGPAEGAAREELEVQFDQLKKRLANQIDGDSLRDARATVTALLHLRPGDPEALEARTYIDQQLFTGIDELHCFQEHEGWVRSVACSADGRRALSGSDDGSLLLWDAENGCALRRFEGHDGAVMSVALSADARLALSGSWDGTVRGWDVATGRELRRLEGRWKAVKSVALSPDGRLALFAGDDHLVRLWELRTGRELRSFKGHTDLIQSLAFTPDGRRLVSGSDDSTIRLWDLESGREHRCFPDHEDTVTSVACSPDGRWILSGSSDKTARLWDVASGRQRYCLDGHTTWVNTVAVSPDGCYALTGSGGEIKDGKFFDGADTTIRLWDLLAGYELCRFEGYRATVTTVVFAGNGGRALSASLDNTVRVLSLPG